MARPQCDTLLVFIFVWISLLCFPDLFQPTGTGRFKRPTLRFFRQISLLLSVISFCPRYRTTCCRYYDGWLGGWLISRPVGYLIPSSFTSHEELENFVRLKMDGNDSVWEEHGTWHLTHKGCIIKNNIYWDFKVPSTYTWRKPQVYLEGTSSLQISLCRKRSDLMPTPW
jgi:hypothetical protein